MLPGTPHEQNKAGGQLAAVLLNIEQCRHEDAETTRTCSDLSSGGSARFPRVVKRGESSSSLDQTFQSDEKTEHGSLQDGSPFFRVVKRDLPASFPSDQAFQNFCPQTGFQKPIQGEEETESDHFSRGSWGGSPRSNPFERALRNLSPKPAHSRGGLPRSNPFERALRKLSPEPAHESSRVGKSLIHLASDQVARQREQRFFDPGFSYLEKPGSGDPDVKCDLPRSNTWAGPADRIVAKSALPRSQTWGEPDSPNVKSESTATGIYAGEDAHFLGALLRISPDSAFFFFLACTVARVTVARVCLSATSAADEMGVQGWLFFSLAVTALEFSCGISGVAAIMLHLRRAASGRVSESPDSGGKDATKRENSRIAAIMMHLRRVLNPRAAVSSEKAFKPPIRKFRHKSRKERMQDEAVLVWQTLSLLLSFSVCLSLKYSWMGLLTLYMFHRAGAAAVIHEFARAVASRVMATIGASSREGAWLWRLGIPLGIIFATTIRRSYNINHFESNGGNRFLFSLFTKNLDVQTILEILSSMQHLSSLALVSVADLACIQFFCSAAVAARLMAGSESEIWSLPNISNSTKDDTNYTGMKGANTGSDDEECVGASTSDSTRPVYRPNGFEGLKLLRICSRYSDEEDTDQDWSSHGFPGSPGTPLQYLSTHVNSVSWADKAEYASWSDEIRKKMEQRQSIRNRKQNRKQEVTVKNIAAAREAAAEAAADSAEAEAVAAAAAAALPEIDPLILPSPSGKSLNLAKAEEEARMLKDPQQDEAVLYIAAAVEAAVEAAVVSAEATVEAGLVNAEEEAAAVKLQSLIRREKDTRKIKELKSEEIVIREDEERMKRGEESIGAVDSRTPAQRTVHLTKEQENITTVAEANLKHKEQEALLLKTSEEAPAQRTVHLTKEQENITTVAEANLKHKEQEALLLKTSEEALARKQEEAEEEALCRKEAVEGTLLLEEDAATPVSPARTAENEAVTSALTTVIPSNPVVHAQSAKWRRALPPLPPAAGTAKNETAPIGLTTAIVSNAVLHAKEKCTASRALPPIPPHPPSGPLEGGHLLSDESLRELLEDAPEREAGGGRGGGQTRFSLLSDESLAELLEDIQGAAAGAAPDEASEDANAEGHIHSH